MPIKACRRRPSMFSSMRRTKYLLLSITASTGCGSPFLKNARAYNSPVFLSSSFMIHSSPLLTTFNIPSHAHLLTSHSSAL
uniref:Uncharacterized protein n=1 Tax=Medicago truncatula TaxID=3880 RepID=I3SGG8_MEDTR|nr:unknown [Medicago truncatula]